MNTRVMLGAAALLIGFAGPSEAAVIFDNENGSTGGGYIVGQYPGSSNDYAIGFSFTAPAGSNPKLAGGSYVASFSTGPANDVTLSLYGSVGGLPGTLVEAWDINNVLGQNSAPIPFASVSHPTLVGGETYWLVASMVDPTSTSVWWTPSGPGNGAVEAVSINGGAFYLSTLPSDYSLGAFEISSVPEPSTWAMMLLGLLGLGFAGIRRAAL